MKVLARSLPMTRLVPTKSVIILCVLGLAGCQTPVSETERIGAMVLAIDDALDAPSEPASLATIARYGTDSRYYVMIRGWLVQELQGVESQLASARDPDLKRKFQLRADFLRQAIRRIDLE